MKGGHGQVLRGNVAGGTRRSILPVRLTWEAPKTRGQFRTTTGKDVDTSKKSNLECNDPTARFLHECEQGTAPFTHLQGKGAVFRLQRYMS